MKHMFSRSRQPQVDVVQPSPIVVAGYLTNRLSKWCPRRLFHAYQINECRLRKTRLSEEILHLSFNVFASIPRGERRSEDKTMSHTGSMFSDVRRLHSTDGNARSKQAVNHATSRTQATSSHPESHAIYTSSFLISNNQLLLSRLMVIRLIIPEQCLQLSSVYIAPSPTTFNAWEGLTLSPFPQKKFFVRMFMYGYSVLSSSTSWLLCSQCSSHNL